MPRTAMSAPALAAIGLLGALSMPALARGAGGEEMVPDSRLGTRIAPLLLLGRPDVRADLGLTPEQTESARRAVTELFARAVKIRGLAGPAAVAARRAIDEDQRRWIEEELNDRQRARLDQIDLQWEGPPALVSRPAVAKELGLSAEQREALKGAVDRRNALRAGGGSQPQNEHKLAREALAILTPDQRDRWLAMLGAPFVPKVAGAHPGPAPARR